MFRNLSLFFFYKSRNCYKNLKLTKITLTKKQIYKIIKPSISKGEFNFSKFFYKHCFFYKTLIKNLNYQNKFWKNF